MNNKVKDIIDYLIKCKNEDKEMKYQPEDILTIEDVWLILDYITNLQEKNKQLKENLEVSQDNEETYSLEMQEITKILGLDEHTLFDDVKQYVKNQISILTELEEWLNKEMLGGRSKDHLWLQGCYDEDKLVLDKIQKLKEKYK